MVIYSNMDHQMTKDDLSPVTIADYASQAVVAYFLSEAFPFDSLVAEEDASALRIPLEGAAPSHAGPLLEQVTHFVSRFLPQASPSKVCQWIDYGRAILAGRSGCWIY
jgi:3'(2'), 5'-bisphosphate nucleotidase